MAERTELVSLEQASRQYGIPRSTLYAWRYERRGPRSFRLGRRVFYTLGDLESWIAQARDAAADDRSA
jgi:predicted DNA-binding transcriptional regulator AlpA